MIRSTKRRRLAALLALGGLTAGAAVMTAGSAQALPEFAITRIFGPDRAGTAAEIAEQTFPGGATNAIIVRDTEFADALAGNYFAGQINAPILLTGTNAIPQATLQTLADLSVDKVFLLGGTAAISDGVAAAFGTTGVAVERIAGTDRFDTAARIALGGSLLPGGVGTIGAERVAVVSSGRNFPDALSAGPIVYSEHLPQLLTEVNTLPAATLTALQSLEIDRVILTGGTTAVSETVRNAIAGAGMTVTRIAGSTRYDTSLQLAVFAGTNFGYEADHVNFATGNNFPDALAGGPHGGTENAPIILTPTVGGADATFVCDALDAISATLATAHVFGGTGAVPDATVDALEACGQGTATPPGTGQVVTVTNGSDQYSFVQTSNNTEVTVTHDAQDTFKVDGAAVNQAVFEGAITPGDQIKFTDDTTATDADVHELTNVVLTAGMVGNVDTSANTFDIINPITGDDVGGWTWNDAADTFGGTLLAFENSISEGDSISVTVVASDPTAFALTNAAVNGAVTVATADAVEADIEIGVFGDEAENNQNVSFNAKAANGATEDYVVDGNASATYEQFRTAVSVGDTLNVTRADVAGVSVETFTLTNVAPPAITGQLFYLFETQEDAVVGVPLGDRLAVVPAGGGYVGIDYTNTPPANFKVDNVIVDEAGFEAALSAGDTVTFQPGSATPAVAETLSLTNQALSGQLANVNTGAHVYAVFAADKATVLAVVDYTAAGAPPLTNQYFINGTQRTLAQWDALAADVLVVGDLDDTIAIDEAGGFRNHRLTTTDTLTP